jgi:F-type H+-transporting ATPase subunit delta
MTQPAEQDNAARHGTVLDVNVQRIARLYAEAILRAAPDTAQAAELVKEFEALGHDVLASDPHLAAFFASTAVGRDRKAKVIDTVFKGRASELFVNALQVLNDHERLELLGPLIGELRELFNERTGKLRVLVRSAMSLPDNQRERLLQKLRDTFRKEPVLDVQIDPELLGGMVVQVGDWVYDQSVKTQLDNLRKQLIARSSYEIQSGRDRFSSANGN